MNRSVPVQPRASAPLDALRSQAVRSGRVGQQRDGRGQRGGERCGQRWDGRWRQRLDGWRRLSQDGRCRQRDDGWYGQCVEERRGHHWDGRCRHCRDGRCRLSRDGRRRHARDGRCRGAAARPGFAVSLLVAAPLALACSSSPSSVQLTELAEGTWGGDDVGVVVSADNAHVHVGCTKGDFPAPIALDADQRFSVSGSYLIKAYPVAIGPTMPAEFAGVVEGNRLTFTVAVNDTIEQKLEVLG